MITGPDHVIIAVNDLPAASQRFEQQTGLVVTPGGDHPGWGTYNAIVRFGVDYLELIAVRDFDEATRHPRGQALVDALQQGEGLLGFVLGTDDIGRTVEAVRRRGLTVEDPQPGSRNRPDGSTIYWQTAKMGGDIWGHRLPFLIQHGSTPEERRRMAPKDGHPLGTIGIASVAVAVRDLDTAIADYRRLVDLDPVIEDVPALPARRASFRLGEFSIDLLCPQAPDGGLAEFIRARGEGIFLVSFAVGDLDRAVEELRRRGTAVGAPTPRRRAPLLDPSQTLGARIQLIERP